MNGKEVKLLDDGDQSNSDLLSGDGIYSARVNMTAQSSGPLTLVVGMKVNDSWQEVSLPTTILVSEALTQEQAQEVIKTTTTLQELVEQLQQDGKGKEEIKEVVLDELHSSQEVSLAGTAESDDMVWYALNSGVLGALSVEETNDIEKQTLINQEPSRTSDATSNSVPTAASVGNKRAIILSAEEFSESNELSDILKGKGFTVDHFKSESANVEQFKTMFNYGTIVFDTSSAALFKENFKENLPHISELYNENEEQVVILTGELVTEESLQKYNGDLKTGRLVIVNGHYAITPAFIEHYGKQTQFSESLVYVNSAHSLYNETMANQFIKQNAQTYVGFTQQPNQSLVEVFNSMIEGTPVKDALNEGDFVGNGSLVYLTGVSLANGNMELGTDSWISGGHFATISKLGLDENKNWTTIMPTEGKSMGIISSGIDLANEALDGRQSWVYQTFSVPEDANVLKFDYNVVSNEPMQYLGTGYDDTFKATLVEGSVKEPKGSDDYTKGSNQLSIKGSIYDVDWLQSTIDVDEKIIAYESVNSSDWGQHHGDDRQRVDVVFPTGDKTTYMTGWKTLTFDVSEYQGKEVTLKLQTWDLGDTIYPTAVLFDQVHLTYSEAKAMKIAGVDAATIPKNGTVDYQFNALLQDQYGDLITSDISLRLDHLGYRQPVVQQEGTFSLKEEVPGVAIDEETGLLSVSSTAEEGPVVIVAQSEDYVAEHTIQLKSISSLSPFNYDSFTTASLYSEKTR